MTSPVAPWVWLPSRITRTAALVPSFAATVFGLLVIGTGSPVETFTTLTWGEDPPVRLLVESKGGTVRSANWPMNEMKI
jgi:hypothetical protein